MTLKHALKCLAALGSKLLEIRKDDLTQTDTKASTKACSKMKCFKRLVEALLFGAPSCELRKCCNMVLSVRCSHFRKSNGVAGILQNILRELRKMSSDPCTRMYVSSAPAGDVGLFLLLWSSAVHQAGSSGGWTRLETAGKPFALHAEQCRHWNFEIWACLKLKLESKPPGRKQCEPCFATPAPQYRATAEAAPSLCGSRLRIKQRAG